VARRLAFPSTLNPSKLETPEPKVSVVMPVHNEEAFLAEAVESALGQDYRNLEVVIADDGSTDRTNEIAQEFARSNDGRVVVVRADHNEGRPNALNNGLAASSGDLIAWLDGDDVMLPGKVSTLVGLLESNPDAVGCCHDAEVFDFESNRVLGRFSSIYNGRPLRDGGVELWFDPTYRILPSMTMVRASACPEHHYDIRLPQAHDWLFDIEVFRQGRCVVSQDVLLRYRRHSGQMTDPQNQRHTSTRWFEAGLMVMSMVEARYPELQGPARTSRAALLLGEARRRAASGEWRLALSRAWGALRAGGIVGLVKIAAHVARVGRRSSAPSR
jgi:glycosyltransferase involved in cell wall biosynthesis